MKRLFLYIIFLTLPSIKLIDAFESKINNNLPGIFSFGDSILDAGNNHFIKNCTAQADFPPYGSSFFHHPTGRFTNGRTVVDFICEYCILCHVWYNLYFENVFLLCMHQFTCHNIINSC